MVIDFYKWDPCFIKHAFVVKQQTEITYRQLASSTLGSLLPQHCQDSLLLANNSNSFISCLCVRIHRLYDPSLQNQRQILSSVG